MKIHIIFSVVVLAALSVPANPGRFVVSDRCMACHNGIPPVGGEDVSIGANWRASMMAHSAADPYWHAAVRRETVEHPASQAAIEDECATCHMPMARHRAAQGGGKGAIFAHLPITRIPSALGHPSGLTAGQLAADAVSCSVCHQIQDKLFGERQSFVGGFTIDEQTPFGGRPVYGPFEVDAGRETLMRSATGFKPGQGMHVQHSELCATCHTLYTHTLGPDGEVVGELPEQVPYLEWRHSAYKDTQSCQDCHMPVLSQPASLTSILPQDREHYSRHSFRGGNFFMLELLAGQPQQLAANAPAAELAASALRTRRHLEDKTARLALEGVSRTAQGLTFDVVVRNLAGHKLPTAYPSRRVWLHVRLADAAGSTLFESGRLRPDGSIEGNDNDVSADRYEPHHRRIEAAEQVQIYEAIMAMPDGRVTTGLLNASHFVKDNRLLPDGFKKVDAPEDIAVQGGAADDAGFTEGGDRVRYAISNFEGQAARLEVELYYQPIAFRWAQNLAVHDTTETNRFLGLYNSNADQSAVVLARIEKPLD